MRFGSSFLGRNLQTTLVKVMPLCRSHEIFLKRMKQKVSMPLVCCPVLVGPLPMPWYRRPSSFLYEVSQMGPSLGLRQSWRCSRYWPVYGSRIERSHLVRKLDGYRRLEAAMGGTVCERVQWDTGSCTGGGCSLGMGMDPPLEVAPPLMGMGSPLGLGMDPPLEVAPPLVVESLLVWLMEARARCWFSSGQKGRRYWTFPTFARGGFSWKRP